MDWDSESRETTEAGRRPGAAGEAGTLSQPGAEEEEAGTLRRPGADGEAGTLSRPGAEEEEEEEAGTLRKEMNRSVHLRSGEDRGEAPSKISI